jgi:hypothetical protein
MNDILNVIQDNMNISAEEMLSYHKTLGIHDVLLKNVIK